MAEMITRTEIKVIIVMPRLIKAVHVMVGRTRILLPNLEQRLILLSHLLTWKTVAEAVDML